MYRVGEVILVQSPCGAVLCTGVVVVNYDHSCFIEVLKNYGLRDDQLKPWRKIGCVSRKGFYVTKDHITNLLCGSTKFTYRTSASSAFVTKEVTPPFEIGNKTHKGFPKKIPGHEYEVYHCNGHLSSGYPVPKFILLHDLRTNKFSLKVRTYEETASELINLAFTEIQVSNGLEVLETGGYVYGKEQV